ncbi:nucleotidyltransferase family protein [Palleronia sp. KMU-117]|uniref:nucleotidyltransferase family protein n=1 Tax=Palleronia sp. KMU-117 TaxID=3434108 RepID=UPI003D706579
MITAGLLLAAGRSTRFGANNKLLAPLRGRPLLCWAAGTLGALPLDHRIAVTADRRVAALLPGFDVVTTQAGSDQSASLRTGVARAQALGADLLLVALADMPLITPDLLEGVLRRARRHGAAAASEGALRAPPAAFAAGHFDALLALTGDRGAGALLRDLPNETLEPAPGLLADVDTPADLAALRP